MKCDLTKLTFKKNFQTWLNGIEALTTGGHAEPYHLFSNRAVLAKLPSNCSRHNAPSRAHAITKIVKGFSTSQSENVVLVCPPSDVYASGCAVARAYSLYNRKTSSSLIENAHSTAEPSPKVVSVEFVCPDQPSVSQDDLSVLEHAKDGIQMAARIVDTPCNEMHTDAFVEETKSVAKALNIKPPLVIRGEELDKKGFGGIYGVGKAAVHPPALVVLSHEPKGATQTIAWVGKGIVYDTGGLSIKVYTL